MSRYDRPVAGTTARQLSGQVLAGDYQAGQDGAPKVRKRLPRAIEMVYDNYNALVIGYSPTDRPSDAILSIVIFPRWVSVCFIQGAQLPDPQGVLQGKGNQVRHIRLDAGAAILDTPAVRALVSEAIAFGDAPFSGKNRLVIRSISRKQRPRR